MTKFNSSVTNSKALWRNIKKLKGEKPNPQIYNLSEDNKIVTDKNDIFNIFNRFFMSYPKELHEKLPSSKNCYEIPNHNHSIFFKAY